MMKKIGEVSKELNLPVATIRYYCDSEMIPSLKRNNNGQRLFDDESVEWLKGTKYLRELGMPVKDIKYYQDLCTMTGDEAIKKRHSLILKQYKIAQAELKNAQQRVKFLKEKIDFEDGVIAHKYEDYQNPARKYEK